MGASTANAELERGRASYVDEAWAGAFDALSRADEVEPLGPDDLELLARSAYMLGRDDDYVSGLERAHHAHVAAGDVPRAARCAVWIGHSFLFRGQVARATGWFARGQRLLDEDGRDCVELGYLRIPVWLEQLGSGDHEAGHATAGEAVEIGERFGDPDLVWLARHEQARALVMQGRVEEGLRVVDEALVVAEGGELSSVVTGIVYCNTIAFCRAVYELRHVREWTEALTRWCERQPEMVAHNGLCLVHRAEIMLLDGAWDGALEEARRCAARFTEGVLNRLACGNACYLQGEAHRLRGDLPAAERAYREASQWGREPQPGLALLRLVQGNLEAATAAIRRVVGETTDPLGRAELLPAYVEIVLAANQLESAHGACRELEEIAEEWGNEVLAAMAARAAGSVALVDGRPADALVELRRASMTWNELGAVYEAGRTRMLIGEACRALGDEDSAGLELDAARAAFEDLGAVLDALHVDEVRGRPTPAPHGLTKREVEVLRLVAVGKSNREIASVLVISQHTVARHVQNIFTKLDVSSRSAATAYAFTYDLV